MTPATQADITRLLTEVLAIHGGLNDRSTRAMLEVARLHGLDAPQITEILEQIARHEHDATILRVTQASESTGARGATAGADRDAESMPRRAGPARATMSILTVVFYLASVALLALTWGVISRPSAPPPAEASNLIQPSARDALQRPPTVDPQLSAARETSPHEPADRDSLLGPFDEAPERYRQVGAEAIQSLASPIAELAATWPELDRATVEGAANRISRLAVILQESGNQDGALQLLDLVLLTSSSMTDRGRENTALPRTRIIPAAWSVGIANRLTKETHTDPRFSERLDAHLDEVFDRRDRPYRPSFHDGASDTLVLLSDDMVDVSRGTFANVDEGAWDEIARGLDAIADHRSQTARAAALKVLTVILRHGGDPAVSSFSGKGLSAIVPLVDWSEREAGQATLSFFDDPQIPTRNLAALMREIVNQGFSPDLSSVPMLTPAAPPLQRARVRDQVAEAYVLPSSPGDGWVEHTWSPALLRALDGDGEGTQGSVGALARAATFARLNAAAALRWEGELPMAEQEIKAVFDAVGDARTRSMANNSTETEPRALTAPASPSDGLFARAYLNAGRSTEGRLEAIAAHAQRPTPIEPADADVLAQAAYYAVPMEVRRAAQQAARAHSESIPMMHALLESLHGAPRLQTTREYLAGMLGADLPDHDAPTWELETRRAVLAKLHRLLADQAHPLVSGLSLDLERTSRLRARGAVQRVGEADSSRLYEKHRSLASQFGDGLLESHAPPRVERRHTRRIAIAAGPAQRFHAHQLSSCELFAYTVTAERPSVERRVREILTALERARENSSHIFEQIHETERAMSLLWALRLSATFEQPRIGSES